MSINLGDFLKVRLKMTVDGVACYNMFHFRVQGGINASYATEMGVAIGFNATVVTPLMPMLSAGTIVREIRVTNLSDVGEPFAILPVSRTGTLVGATMPSFTCFSIRQNVSTNVTRNGYKRFSGITEEVVAGGVFIGSYPTAGTNLAGLLGTDALTLHDAEEPSEDIVTVANVILKSTVSTPPASGEWQYVTSAQFMNRVTSQTSRKFFNSDG